MPMTGHCSETLGKQILQGANTNLLWTVDNDIDNDK